MARTQKMLNTSTSMYILYAEGDVSFAEQHLSFY